MKLEYTEVGSRSKSPATAQAAYSHRFRALRKARFLLALPLLASLACGGSGGPGSNDGAVSDRVAIGDRSAADTGLASLCERDIVPSETLDISNSRVFFDHARHGVIRVAISILQIGPSHEEDLTHTPTFVVIHAWARIFVNSPPLRLDNIRLELRGHPIDFILGSHPDLPTNPPQRLIQQIAKIEFVGGYVNPPETAVVRLRVSLCEGYAPLPSN